MASALPIITALAPLVFQGIGALSNKKPQEYSSGLSPQDQNQQNWMRQQVMQQQAQGPSKASRDAQAFLYRRFGLGNAPQYPGIPLGVQPQQQPPVGGGQGMGGGGIDPAMLAAFMQSRQQGGGAGNMAGAGW